MMSRAVRLRASSAAVLLAWTLAGCGSTTPIGGPTVIGRKADDDGDGTIDVPCGMSHGGAGGPGVIQLHVPSIAPPGDDPRSTDVLIV